MPKKMTAQILLIVLNLAALLFFVQGRFAWSGSAMVIAGVLGTLLRRPGAEVVVLVGFSVASLVLENKLVTPLLFVVLFCVGAYDLIQCFRVMNDMKASGNPDSHPDWSVRFREKELLHRLLKIIASGVKSFL